MTAPRRKSSKSFLDDYRTDIDPLVIPDRARGRPGLLPARDPDGRSVLVKFWARDDNTRGRRDRGPRDAAAVPRAEELFVPMVASGEDNESCSRPWPR